MGRRIQAYLCRVDRDQLYRKTINALNDLKKLLFTVKINVCEKIKSNLYNSRLYSAFGVRDASIRCHPALCFFHAL